MKKLPLYMLPILSLFTVFSCSDEGFEDPVREAVNPEDLPWMATTNLEVSGVEEKENFVWETNLLTSEEYWGVEDVEYQVAINSEVEKTNFSKIEFYITLQEENGYNYSAPFDYEGKLAATVNQWNEEGEFSLSFNVEDTYAMFIDNLKFDRSAKLARAGDLFEVHWVIYGKDGETFDSRLQSGAKYRFTFLTKLLDFAPPIWAGTYNYEWIEATANAVRYGRITVGQTGTVTISQVEGQTYYMSNLMFGYYYAGAGNVVYDFLDGLVYVEGSRQEKWHIINIDGPSMDIALEYQYSAGYDEYCTVRITRTDGTDWPTHIYTE
ncbi:hypothetical protein [Robertkochia solimangrovi]|uniref:hypothetical protein n=1 Tax=Robertkochia solimangrovi TaxID=2213046 RepID=UPI00117EA57A|nr:hypothetical protein [Robertkochia solimangrovi]TRZ41302.1 hypothetical protein DMZ48_17895 [Robertkochia solimangrovi]